MTFIPYDLAPCPICKTGILRGVYGTVTCDNCKRSFGLAPLTPSPDSATVEL